MENIVTEKVRETTAQIYKRIESEDLHSKASYVLLGLCMVKMEELLSKRFIEDAKRTLDIVYEEYIELDKKIKDILGDKPNVS